MQALVAYLNWVGHQQKKGEKRKGTGLVELPLLDRAASPDKGKVVYLQKGQSCHGPQGRDLRQPEAREYTFPAAGSGLCRLCDYCH